MKMATRSTSNKGIAKGMTYGEGVKLGRQIDEFGLPVVDGRSTNIPPAATNQTDQTRTVPMEEEVSVAMNTGGQPVTPPMPMGMGNILDLKRPTERPYEKLTSGIVSSLTPQEIGDLDFAVLADLAENSDVNALRQAFSI
tara:strand:+ start:261 stop:680 length:420 start_codon:yes stop_codon:yes gene_type:complete